MLGETVHAYILTPALAIALPRLRTLPRLVAVTGGEAVEPTAIAVGCRDIARPALDSRQPELLNSLEICRINIF